MQKLSFSTILYEYKGDSKKNVNMLCMSIHADLFLVKYIHNFIHYINSKEMVFDFS